MDNDPRKRIAAPCTIMAAGSGHGNGVFPREHDPDYQLLIQVVGWLSDLAYGVRPAVFLGQILDDTGCVAQDCYFRFSVIHCLSPFCVKLIPSPIVQAGTPLLVVATRLTAPAAA